MNDRLEIASRLLAATMISTGKITKVDNLTLAALQATDKLIDEEIATRKPDPKDKPIDITALMSGRSPIL
jgi:hypothetical protein